MGLKDSFTEIIVKTGRVTFLKKLLRKPYDFIVSWSEKRSLKVFKKNGFEALASFDKILTEHGYKYTLAFGTLLGAVRENNFIPYDDDIDVAMWYDDFTPTIIDCLAAGGIKLKHSFSVSDGKLGKEDSFDYKGVQIDVFYFYRDENNVVYCCDFVNQPDCATRSSSVKKHGGLLPRKLFMPLGNDISRIQFKGIEVSIPSNYKEILSFRYGEDYMTPKPGWKPKTEYIKEVPEWLGVYKEY